MLAKLARTAISVLAALAIFFVAGEILARALDIVDRLNGYGRNLVTRGPSVDLPYLLRPGLRTSMVGTDVRVNRFGFRGPEIEPTPPPGVRRVLVLGDSVVFGQGMREEETIAGVLARELNAAGDQRWETINAGVFGYDAVSEVRLLELRGLALAPDVVVVGTSLNDYDVTPQLSPLGFLVRKDLGAREPRLADRSEFLALLRWLVGYTRGTLWYQAVEKAEERRRARIREGRPEEPRLLAAERVVEQQHLAFYRHPEPAYWNRLRGAFAELAGVGRDHRVPILVAIFPEEYQVKDADPDLTPQRRLLELCRETELPCLDLQPAFVAAGGELFQDLMHPNARGHAVAGATVARALLAPLG